MLLSIYLRVADYDRRNMRAEYGATRHSVYHQEGNPNQLLLTIEFPDVRSARSYVEDSGLREAMTRAGVQGEPGFAYFEELETVTY